MKKQSNQISKRILTQPLANRPWRKLLHPALDCHRSKMALLEVRWSVVVRWYDESHVDSPVSLFPSMTWSEKKMALLFSSLVVIVIIVFFFFCACFDVFRRYFASLFVQTIGKPVSTHDPQNFENSRRLPFAACGGGTSSGESNPRAAVFLSLFGRPFCFSGEDAC